MLDSRNVTVAEHRDYVGDVASQPETADVSRVDETLGGAVTNSRFFAAQIADGGGT